MQTKINKAVSQIIQDVMERPLYPESKHITMASNYPEGKLKYFRDQRFELIKVIPENSMFGNAWVNSGTPKVTSSQLIVDFYNNKFINPPTGITYQSQSEFMDFLKSDLSSFLRDYIAYSKMGAELENSMRADYDIPDQSNDHSYISFQQFDEILLNSFISDMDYETFKYVIKYKKLPDNKKKGFWKNKNVEAYRFIEIFDMKIMDFNNCFYLKKGKLHGKNKPTVPNGDINFFLKIDSPRK